MSCSSRHTHRAVDAPPEPKPLPEDPTFRASDAEREQAVVLLREHGAAGRLELDELEQRTAAAYTARTRGELHELLTDLPGAELARPRAAVAKPPRRRELQLRRDWILYTQVSVLFVAIWAFSGAGYFWPVWPMLGWGLALALKTAPGLLRLR